MILKTNPVSVARACGILALVAAALASGCGGSTSSPMKTAGMGGTMTSTGGTGGTPTTPTIVSIAVAPAAPSIAPGATQQFTATATYSNSTMTDVSATAVWASSVTGTATISAAGLATALAGGTTTISATSAGVMGSTTLTVTSPTVTPPTLTSIVLSPAAPSIMVGATQAFVVTGKYSDASMKDLTTMSTFTSGTPATATISAAGVATGVAAGTTVITATSGGMSATAALAVTAPAVLMTIVVTPTNPAIAVGTTQQLTATGNYNDGSKKDLSATATWASATPAKVTVSPAGLATAVAPGTSIITATSGTVMGTTTVTVNGATLMSIAVTPAAPSIAAGTTKQFTATGTFKDAANVTTTQDLTAAVTWASATVATATISAAGLATGKAMGTTVISATSGTIVGMLTLTVTKADLVSIAVTTPTASIAKGTKATFIATGTFTDATTQDLSSTVTWASATPATATISGVAGSIGVATSLEVGTTVISAKQTNAAGTVITGTATLTVTGAVLASISVTAELPVPSATPTIASGTKMQLIATGIFTDSSKQDLTDTVNWTSATGAVATVSNAAATAGLVTGVAPGANNVPATAVISATSGTIVGKLTVTVTNETLLSIVVTPGVRTIAAGTSQQYVATGFFTDGSEQFLTDTATWASGTVATATISNAAATKGLASGKAVGTSLITASVGNITNTTSATLTVSMAVVTSLSITPNPPGLALGTTLQLTATGIFSDTTKQPLTAQVAWASATPAVATISNAAGSIGLVTPVKKGTTDITATYVVGPNQTVTATVTLTVSDAKLKSIAISSSTSLIEKGTTVQYTATGTYTDGATQDITKMVTWKSDKTTVATVSNTAASAGLVTAQGTGTAVISATSDLITDTDTLTVNDGLLLSIAVSPASATAIPTIAVGTKLQLKAIGSYNDGAKQDITASVTWASDATVTATVDTAGLASGVKQGTAKISATQGTIVGSTTLTVNNTALLSIALDPHPTATIAKGTTVQFTATGFFQDLSKQDLTDSVTWASSNIATATISNAPDSNGLAFGKASSANAVNITATLGTIVSVTIPLTVTPATLTSIAITTTPAATPATVAKGSTLNLVATGTYSDQTTQVLTGGAVTWGTSMAAVATISNAAGSRGRVTGAGVGSTDITATSSAATGSIVGHLTVTGTAAAVVSIAVTPAAPTIVKTHTQQFTAMATMTDGTKVDVTTTATWAATTVATATISDAAGTKGLATGVAAGTTPITATSGTIVGTANLTVTN
jgi:hypothetical protein